MKTHVESFPLRSHQIEMLNILKSKPGILRGHVNNDVSREKMLALPGYERDYFNEWTKPVGANMQVVGRKPREGIMAASMAPQPLVNEANERFLMGDKPTKDE